MNLEDPFFGDPYVTIGAAALVVVLLVLLLVVLRRRRSKAAQRVAQRAAAAPGVAPSVGPPFSAPAPVTIAPPTAAPTAASTPTPTTAHQTAPTAAFVVPPTVPQAAADTVASTAAYPVFPSAAPIGTQPAGSLVTAPLPEAPQSPPPFPAHPGTVTAPLRVGDPVVAMITSLLDDDAELSDANLRRLELFKPERVLRTADDLAATLTGRGKESKRARLGTIRQYAQSLQVAPQTTQMAERVAGPPPIPVPPPGSGTDVLPPEAWGATEDTTAAIPLDTELSYLGEGMEPALSQDEVAGTPSPVVLEAPPPAALVTRVEPPAPSVAAERAESQPPEGPSSVLSETSDTAESPVQPGPSGAWDWNELAAPEPPPAFPMDEMVEIRPDLPPVEERPAVPEAPPAFPPDRPATREVPSEPGRETAEVWERPVIVERDTLGGIRGGFVRPEPPTTVQSETLVPGGGTPPGAIPPGEPAAPSAGEDSLPVEPAASAAVEDSLPVEPAGGEPQSLTEAEQIASLGTLGPDELGRLQDTDASRDVRLAVVDRLEELGSAEALAALDRYLDDTDPEVLLKALDAAERLLARLGGRPA